MRAISQDAACALGLTLLLVFMNGCAPTAPASAVHAAATGDAQLVVRKGTFVRRVLLTGEMKAVRAEEIVVPRTPIWSVQIRWMEADGAEVKAGQKVVEFDNSSFAAQLEERRLAASRAANELAQQQAQNATATAERGFVCEQRRVALEKARIDADLPDDVVSRRDFQDKQLALERAHTEHDKARDDLSATRKACDADLAVRRIALEKAQREVREAEGAIAKLAVVAPRAGILQIADHPWEGRKFQVGDTPWVGLTVARIPDLSELQADAMLFDVDDGQIAVNAPVACALDAFPEERFTGTILAITPVAQEAGRTSARRAFRASVALAHSDSVRMRPGMSVKIEVEAERREGVLLAPRVALAFGGTAPRAWLRTGKDVEVGLGPCAADACIVESGLAEGARLRRAPPGGPQ